ncbi:MAG: PilC/PilY family type IV pilus protein [Nevskia sp.]
MASEACRCLRASAGLLSLFAAMSIGPAQAETVTLPDLPLFLTQSVKPNIILAIDDSGSMNDEVLMSSNDGSAWWRTGASGTCTDATAPSFVGCISDGAGDVPSAGVLNFNHTGGAGGSWRNYTYLFPNGQSSPYDGRLIYNDSGTNGHYSIPPIPAFGWARSPAYNPAYFDPAQTYTPWVTFTAPYGNVAAASAPSDPTRTTSTFDLTRDRADNVAVGPSYASTVPAASELACTLTGVGDDTSGNATFRQEPGMVLPVGTCYYDPATSAWKIAAADVTATAAQNAAIRYFPATFYLPPATAVPSGYGYTGAATPVGLSPDGQTSLNRYEIKRDNFATQAQYDTAIQNFANWFTYYRKRHLAMRGGVGAAFKDLTGLRVDAFTINSPATVTMQDLDVAAQKNALFERIYGSSSGNSFVGGGGTPNRTAVKAIGTQYKRTDSGAPIQYACQQNFGILFTDGYSNGSSSDTAWSGTGNVDGAAANASHFPTGTFKDAVSDTMADGVAGLYIGPLRTGTGFPLGKVNLPSACSVTTGRDVKLDCNGNLHMNFYAVTLGTRGVTFGVNAAQTADPYTNAPTWPISFPDRHPVAVDDLWHATINARGRLLNAATPKEIAGQLGAVLRSISEQTASASAVSLNSSSLNTGSLLFQAGFNSANWTGELTAFRISNGTTCGTPGERPGSLCPASWTAAAKLDLLNPDTGRTILTYKPTASAGASFRWSSLEAAQQLLLNIDPTSLLADTNGALRLSYLRGDRSQEASGATPRFRVRGSTLGDIVGSDPFSVGAPNFAYGFTGYATFRARYRSRTPMVYVGANDGMLHGFRASDGVELLAYVPNKAFGSTTKPLLAGLTRSPFVHRNLVDGSPTVGDAEVNGAWKSVLVAGMRAGGQGLYALDVTDPSAFSETNTATALWEFTDADDADLGYTYSQPSIVKMANGKWAAIVGSGYNNTEADGRVGSGRAALFIIFLDGPGSTGWGASGTRYVKLSTPAGSALSANGLATPAAVDTDGDGMIDSIYAGDQLGNLWRFDVGDSAAANWKVAYATTASPDGAPLFVAKDAANAVQQITARPEVGYNLLASDPTNATSPKLVVYFGTGRYLASGDNNAVGQQTQTFYGIFDSFSATAPATTRSKLQRQRILQQVTTGTGSYRVTSNETLDPAVSRGWYLDLYNTGDDTVTDPGAANLGERQVSTPILRGGRIIFTTLIPSADPCDFGGSGWLMELDARSGKRLPVSPIDTSNSQTVDAGDNVVVAALGDGSNVSVPVSGVQSTVGIPSMPGILGIPGNLEIKYSGGSRRGIQQQLESAAGRIGRITWREINP